MKNLLKYFIWISFIINISPLSHADTLDDLLQKVMAERTLQTKELLEREKTFEKKFNQRKSLLQAAKQELKKEEILSEKLTKTYETNEKELTILEAELQATVGVLGEFFGVVKQVSGDFRGHILHSLVSVEIPGRAQWIESIATKKKLPNTKELRHLWFEIQREITELGKVSKFQAEVISIDGSKSIQNITRIGGFNLVSQGHYLTFEEALSSNSHPTVLELNRQPARKFTRYISDLELASSGYHFFALDPSRGSLISILTHIPDLWEKIQQGGWVGFVIICVFLFGLIIVIERIFILHKEKQKILKQLNNTDQIIENNPVGEILISYKENQQIDLESLELKLSEVIIKYLPKLERGISTVKMLAMLSPLLGLLGTVTGMILTFQSITLFGTGDPKLMAGGISQALVTTVMGLCCAIPLILAHTVIVSHADRLRQILEEQIAGLLAGKIQDRNKPT